MVIISGIASGGIADSLGLQVGDRIVSVASRPVRDFLDVLIAERLCDVELVIERIDGDLWHLDIEKEADAPFGLALEHPDPAHCGNNCLFCFVHQLPKGMRRTLYVKDEDYRFSYLYGAYVTLSNLKDAEIDRIIQQKLSPLYVSVHAVNPELRSQLLGRQVAPILPVLQRLVDNGIELHTQIVVCPGVNDGEALAETVQALIALAPGVCSLALVPLGLTAHRQKLPTLMPVSREDAQSVLSALQVWQGNCLNAFDSRFVFAADEFYLRAGADIPDLAEYEDLAQIENGVGKIALFRNEAEAVYEDAINLHCPVEFTIVTGKAFHKELSRFIDKLSDLLGCDAHLYAIENSLFGDMVTVAGLIGGNDIVEQLKGKKLGSALLIPDVMMRDGDDCFLDDMTPADLEKNLGCKVIVIEDTPWGILDAAEELA
jgi:putative radical SAM enzyme (TIGR03279 family)